MRTQAYGEIALAGGDIGTPLDLRKRLLQLGARASGIELSRRSISRC